MAIRELVPDFIATTHLTNIFCISLSLDLTEQDETHDSPLRVHEALLTGDARWQSETLSKINSHV